MKTAFLSAALMLASTVAMAQKSNFQLKVDLKNFNSDSVLVYKGRNVKMDTVLVKNGKFTYSVNLDKAAGYVSSHLKLIVVQVSLCSTCLVFLARRLKLRAMQRPALIFRVLSSISSIMK